MSAFLAVLKGWHLTAECNGSHGHWRTAAAKRDKLRSAVATLLWHEQMIQCSAIPPLPVVVTFTRVAPQPLDDDNLPGAFKSARDEVAVWLGLPTKRMRPGQKWAIADDRDPRVTWKYDKRRGGVREYAVEIRVEARVAP